MKHVKGNTVYTMLKTERRVPPTITFTQKALKWIAALVEQHDIEVGFLGLVEENEEQYSFLVTDIFYPKHQAANGGTCEISNEGQTELMNWFIEKDRVSDINRLLLWGHSHHTMGVGPSGQDEKQALDMMQSSAHHIISIIVNKEKLMSVSFFDYKLQVRFDNIAWQQVAGDTEAENQLTLSKVQAIISSTDPSVKKLKDIEDVLFTDFEFQAITEKVKVLKEKNMPRGTYGTSGYQGSNGHQIWVDGKWFPSSEVKGTKYEHPSFKKVEVKDGKLVPPPKSYGMSDDRVHQMNLLHMDMDQNSMFPGYENGRFIDDRAPEVQDMMRVWEESAF